MDHIVDYVRKNKDISFTDKPFNEVDALVLSQFCYMKWEGLIPELRDFKDGISLLELDKIMDRNEVFMDERYSKNNEAMWDEMISGKRYQNMNCGYFADRIDEDIETQFCAFCVFPEGVRPIVLYRGTDERLLGWKEDYNMLFSKPVAGQRLAALYLNQVALRIDGDFYIAGHSKGGNLAVYAAMNVNKDIQDRIIKIYNFDGPGFRPEVMATGNYKAISTKVDKMIPKASVFGMMLETSEDYSVVKSSSIGGMLQHNPYSWIVAGDEFAWDNSVKKTAKKKSQSFNRFIMELDEEQIKLFGDTLFDDIFAEADVDTLLEMSENRNETMAKMVEAMKNIDQDRREEFREIFKILLDVIGLGLRGTPDEPTH